MPAIPMSAWVTMGILYFVFMMFGVHYHPQSRAGWLEARRLDAARAKPIRDDYLAQCGRPAGPWGRRSFTCYGWCWHCNVTAGIGILECRPPP